MLDAWEITGQTGTTRIIHQIFVYQIYFTWIGQESIYIYIYWLNPELIEGSRHGWHCQILIDAFPVRNREISPRMTIPCVLCAAHISVYNTSPVLQCASQRTCTAAGVPLPNYPPPVYSGPRLIRRDPRSLVKRESSPVKHECHSAPPTAHLICNEIFATKRRRRDNYHCCWVARTTVITSNYLVASFSSS